MIKKITVDNFKLYNQRTDFDHLRLLNILTGVNGRGKSSFLHTLVLMSQSVAENIWTNTLMLKASDLELGTAADVKNSKRSSSETIDFEFTFENGAILKYCFDASNQQAQELPLQKFECMNGEGEETLNMLTMGPMHNFLPAFENNLSDEEFGISNKIQFISAERIGPKLRYEEKNQLQDKVKSSATNVVAVLFAHKDEPVEQEYMDQLLEVLPEELWNADMDNTIRGQVDLWLTKMFGYSRIHPEFVESVNTYTLSFSTDDSNRKFKATNVGFGYSYVLPILVAGLVAKRGGILIVENPESHLHPQAQSMVSKFLACVAAKGVQVFIETHSEHILNAYRVLIAQKHITNNDVSVKFFDEKYGIQYYKEVPITETGGIEDWPTKFFDQEEKDLNVLVNANIPSES